jgi:hypothetical protein
MAKYESGRKQVADLLTYTDAMRWTFRKCFVTLQIMLWDSQPLVESTSGRAYLSPHSLAVICCLEPG